MKKSIRTLLIIILILVLIVLLFCIKIGSVSVTGNTLQEDEKLVSQIFDSNIDRTSIVFFLKDKLLKHKDITFVDNYKVRWLSPFSIEIDVVEKKPIAFSKKDIKNVYFDDGGTIIEVSEGRKPNIPEVIGISFRNYQKGEKIELETDGLFDAILLIANTLKKENLPLELIEVDRNNNISIYTGKIKTKLGSIDNIKVKVKRLKEIYPEIKDLKGELDLTEARENMADEQYIFKKTA